VNFKLHEKTKSLHKFLINFCSEQSIFLPARMKMSIFSEREAARAKASNRWISHNFLRESEMQKENVENSPCNLIDDKS